MTNFKLTFFFLVTVILSVLIFSSNSELTGKKYTPEEIEELRYLRRREIEERERRDIEEAQKGKSEIPLGPKWSLQQLLPDCIELNEWTFDGFFDKHSSFFLVFLHGDVQEANIFTIHYQKAASTLKEENIPFPFTYVDCQKDRSLLQRFGVKRYPTMMIFNGFYERMFYEGVVNDKVLETIARKHIEPLEHIKTEDDLLKLKGVLNITAFLYLSNKLSDSQSQYYLKRFNKAANEYRALPDIRFAYASLTPDSNYYYVNDKVMNSVNSKGWGVELFKGGADFKIALNFEQPFSTTDLLEFVAKNAFLYVDEMKTSKWRKVVSRNKPVLIMWTDPSQPFHERLITILWEVSEKFYSKGILFLWANSEKESDGMDKQGLVYDDVPAILIFDEKSKIHYMDKRKRITNESLSEFCEEFLKGSTEPFYKPWMSRSAQEKEKELSKKRKEFQKKMNEDAATFGGTARVAVGPDLE